MRLRLPSRHRWLEKPAGDLYDHDIVEGLGMVDWTVGLDDETIRVCVWPQSRRDNGYGEGGRIENLPKTQIVRYRR